MTDIYSQVEEAVSHLSSRLTAQPRVGIVMGTGLGGLERPMDSLEIVPYSEIPHFPSPTAPGHEGRLISGTLEGCPTLILQGRFHFYEGHGTREITLPIRVLGRLGVRLLIVTNAAGGLNPLFCPGDLMAITDHLHWIPDNPLRGLVDERLGDRFPDMTQAYDREMIRIAETKAMELGIPLRKGVYVSVPGPSLETPAETRFLRASGADAVGMSTTPEVIVARSVGLRVLGLSVISNVNRPDCMAPIRVEEIMSVSRRTGEKLARLVMRVLETVRNRL